MAGEDFMLRPLIRHVETIPASAAKYIIFKQKTNRVKFVVEFDKTYVSESEFPLTRIPLLFKSVFAANPPKI